MDVQATADALPLPPLALGPLPTSATLPGSAPSANASPSSAPNGAPGASATASDSTASGSSSGTKSNANEQVQTLPPTDDASKTLSTMVANAFGTAADNVQASFQIDPQSKEVVIVFTNTATGKTIVQIPSETLIALAQFLNKLAGLVLDKKA